MSGIPVFLICESPTYFNANCTVLFTFWHIITDNYEQNAKQSRCQNLKINIQLRKNFFKPNKKPPKKQSGDDGLPIPPYAVYNIGNNQPENLLDFVDTLQQELIRAGVLPEDYDFEAHKKLVPMQAGDVPITYADTSALERDFGFKPSTTLRKGLRKFAEWYIEFYHL